MKNLNPQLEVKVHTNYDQLLELDVPYNLRLVQGSIQSSFNEEKYIGGDSVNSAN